MAPKEICQACPVTILVSSHHDSSLVVPAPQAAAHLVLVPLSVQNAGITADVSKIAPFNKMLILDVQVSVARYDQRAALALYGARLLSLLNLGATCCSEVGRNCPLVRTKTFRRPVAAGR